MTVRKVGNRYAVVKKNGSLGKGRYKTAASAAKAQAKGRALARKNPLKSRPSTRSSGGGSTAVGKRTAAKFGVILRRARTALNLTAPGWGSFDPASSGQNTMDKLTEGIRRYSGYHLNDSTLDLRRAIPTYQGITVSLANDWFDRKLRNSGRISRGKIFPLLSEAIPAIRARMEVPDGDPNPLFNAACNYNKRTTGYDPRGHTWNLDRVEEYAIGKGLVALYNKGVPQDWKSAANKVLPKNINPF